MTASKGAKVQERVILLYRDANDRKRKAVATYLATQLVQDNCARLSSSEIEAFRRIFNGIDSVPVSATFKAHTAERYAEMDMGPVAQTFTSAPARREVPAISALTSEERAAARAISLDTQLSAGLKKMLAETIGLGNDKIAQLASSYANGLVTAYSENSARHWRPTLMR